MGGVTVCVTRAFPCIVAFGLPLFAIPGILVVYVRYVNQVDSKSVLIKSNLEKCICSMLSLLVRRSVQSGGPAISMASRGMAGNAAAGGSSGGNGDGAGGGGGGKKKARGKQDYKWKKKVCFPAMEKKKKSAAQPRVVFYAMIHTQLYCCLCCRRTILAAVCVRVVGSE